MNRSRLVVAAAILFAVVAWFFNRRESTDWTNFPPLATGPWIAFGDSLTAGEGADAGQAYPDQLSQRLGISIINHGQRGDTTADGLAQIETIASAKPRVVLLCLGGNDSLRRLPSEQTFQNLGQIIDRFHAEGSFVVLIGIRSASLIDGFEKRFRQLAKEKKVLYEPDFLDGVLGKADLMADYIHPNDRGYAAFANRLATRLEPFMERLR